MISNKNIVFVFAFALLALAGCDLPSQKTPQQKRDEEIRHLIDDINAHTQYLKVEQVPLDGQQQQSLPPPQQPQARPQVRRQDANNDEGDYYYRRPGTKRDRNW